MRTKRPARAVSEFRYRPLVAAVAVALAPQAALATTKTVTYNGGLDSSAPTPAGSLREALEFFANPVNCTGADTINFAFSNGPFTVNVSEPLPIITCGGLVIDGLVAQPSPEPPQRAIVRSNGAFMSYALQATAISPVVVQNLLVEGFNYGAALAGRINANNNILYSNFAGYDSIGYSALSVGSNYIEGSTYGIRLRSSSNADIRSNAVRSSTFGISIESSSNVTVSGNTVSASQKGIYIAYGGSTVSVVLNAINENREEATVGTYKGVFLDSSAAIVSDNQISNNDFAIYIAEDAGSKITNNRIGTTYDGSAPFGNGRGIVFASSFGAISSNTQISGNVISANTGYGIDLSDFSNVRITNNKIGTTLDGATGMGNGAGGIIAYCGSGIEVSGNVISANSGSAIEFGAVQGGGKLNIVGNKIGVQGNGITALGNSAYGVSLYAGTCRDIIAETNDLLIRGNTIANNSNDGVKVSRGVRNKIVENAIYANGQKNLNLGNPGGPRANDAGDGDGGPNNGQNYPIITTVSRDWPNSRTTVAFTLDTVPGTYRIDVYSGSDATPGGRVHQNSKTISAGTGPTPESIDVPNLSTGNMTNSFTLTATAASDGAPNGLDSIRGDTSEYSAPFTLGDVRAVTVIPNPPTLNFGEVAINAVSPPQAITLLSSGNAPYQIYRMGLNSCTGGSFYGGPFMIANACVSGREYAPGQSCTFTARFAPITPGGPQNMTIGVCDNATFEYGGRSFFLTGTASAPPSVNIAPSEFDFGSVLSGSRSPPQQFVISNPSPSAVAIGPVTVSNGEFAIDATTCGSSIPSGGLCTAHVTFRPTQPVRSEATLSVGGTLAALPGSAPIVKIRNVSSGTASAYLVGQGIQQADITLPPFIDFGAYTLGTPALRQNVVVENVGNAIVSFNTISVSGPFVLTNGCPRDIAPGERCTIALDFSVTTLGDFTGTLSVVSNATGGTRTIPLTARSLAIPVPQLQVTPNSMSFGERLLGTTSATQRVTIRNIGNAPARISSITASPDFVVLGNTCTLALAPTSTCFADVALRPVGFGPRPGSLFVNSNVVGSPNVVGLGGTGCRPFSSSSSRFGMGTGFNCAP